MYFVLKNVHVIWVEMPESNINLIILQDELTNILTAEITNGSQIKGHHIYKDILTPKLGEHLEVYCEPENTVDKYAVCVSKYSIIYELTLKLNAQQK